MNTKNFLLSLLCLCSLCASAQVTVHESLIRIETPKFQKVYLNSDYIYIPMDFNDAQVLDSVAKLDVKKIESISLIYTQYKSSERFDQLKLNQERTYRLFRLYPQLKSADHINWYWIAQTGCSSPEACGSYFHGFEIKLRSVEDMDEAIYESIWLNYYTKYYITGTKDVSILDVVSEPPKHKRLTGCDTIYIERKHANRIGYIKPFSDRDNLRFMRRLNRMVPDSGTELSFVIDTRKTISHLHGLDNAFTMRFNKLLLKHYRVSSSRIKDRRTSTRYTFYFIRDSRGNIIDIDIYSRPVDSRNKELDPHDEKVHYDRKIKCWTLDTTVRSYDTIWSSDNVVTEVFNRNTHWKNCLVVTDVTGSMSPYLGQFLAWHYLNLNSENSNNRFVFFNDGNNMRDMLKRTGNVGGIYSIETHDYQELQAMLTKAQWRGCGGDGPENNVEAMLKGLEEFPDVKEIILIADNWATPRDLSLLHKLKVPVHVILCGSQNGVNVQYLNLARSTKGTVHTIEKDLAQLASLKEGETITIGGNTFKIVNGRFVSQPGSITKS